VGEKWADQGLREAIYLFLFRPKNYKDSNEK
jgi:hypothetical protein